MTDRGSLRAVKTPRRPLAEALIPVRAQSGSTASAKLSVEECRSLASAIAPQLEHYAARNDDAKYSPSVYAAVLRDFRRKPSSVGPDSLRDALLWKWGHLGKSKIPGHHSNLIQEIQRGWRGWAGRLGSNAKADYEVMRERLGGKQAPRFITVSFLVHLLHQDAVPIIDQHNFRAMNALIKGVRPTWISKRAPSQFADIERLTEFSVAVLENWPARGEAPSPRKLDLFLMMYGKAIRKLFVG